MDAQRFDRWTVAMTQRPTRRATLRLLTGGLLGGLLAQRMFGPAFAQRPDRDDDGLYDDDETDVYGTNPDVYDTDGDGVGDGEEVYVGTDPLVPEGGAPPPAPGGGGECPPEGCLGDILTTDQIPVGAAPLVCDAGLANCGTYCANTSQDAANCGICGWDCGNRDLYFCYLGLCVDYCEYPTRRCTGEYFCRNYSEPCPA